MTTDVSWQRLRKLVRTKHGSICYHCGRYAEKGHCDHLMPLSKGGTDAIDNLVWSCVQCNVRKGDKVLPGLSPQIKGESAAVNTPDFSGILPDFFRGIVSYLVPPYPEWDQSLFFDYIYYFEEIMFMRNGSITDWLRQRIWPISENVQMILFSLETLDNLVKMRARYKPSNYKFTFDTCPKCKDSASATLESENGVSYKWQCVNGHTGRGTDEFSDRFMDSMISCAIDWTRNQIKPTPPPDPWGPHWNITVDQEYPDDLPDWLRDVEDWNAPQSEHVLD